MIPFLGRLKSARWLGYASANWSGTPNSFICRAAPVSRFCASAHRLPDRYSPYCPRPVRGCQRIFRGCCGRIYVFGGGAVSGFCCTCPSIYVAKSIWIWTGDGGGTVSFVCYNSGEILTLLGAG